MATDIDIRPGQTVFVRSYNTRRAAIGKVLSVRGHTARVELPFGYYSWDDSPEPEDDIVDVQVYRLEPMPDQQERSDV